MELDPVFSEDSDQGPFPVTPESSKDEDYIEFREGPRETVMNDSDDEDMEEEEHHDEEEEEEEEEHHSDDKEEEDE